MISKTIKFSTIFKNYTNFRKFSQASRNVLTSLSTNKEEFRDFEEVKIAVGGFSINCAIVGNGPNVVFCHPGIMGNVRVHVSTLMPGFKNDKFTFVTWDQPGYARSAPPERILSDEVFSQDTDMMVQVMDKLGYGKYAVLGWSAGGCSALLAAILYPEIVQKLVVWGCCAYVDKEDFDNYGRAQKPENQRGKMVERFWEIYGKERFQNHFWGWNEIFRRIYSNHEGEFVAKRLDKIKCPTLILHGSKDNMIFPKHGQFLNDRIKNSRFVRWEGESHNLHSNKGKQFNKIVTSFLLEKED